MTTSAPARPTEPRLQDVGLDEKVAFLRDPRSYPAPPARIDMRQTHMSYVFLTADEAYKLKRPVRYPFLDFSTLAARAASCRAEVALNRRLAPDVYLGVVPLTRAPDGRIALGGEGVVIDWLVRMRRLPAERMLDALIIERRLDARDLAPLAGTLADFYAAAPRAGIAPDQHLALLANEHRLNMDVLQMPRFELDRGELAATDAAIRGFLAKRRDLLAARVTGGRVVEGHGDLRPEHVCLTKPPRVIDCLEFNRELRLVDWADEIAFLGLECALLGAPWVGAALHAPIAARLNDAVPPALTDFYTALRACLRARLAVAHLLEPDPRDGARWLPRARAYLRVAGAARESLGSG
jgi:aminoglycoside phosphotransferase family enzyme